MNNEIKNLKKQVCELELEKEILEKRLKDLKGKIECVEKDADDILLK